MSTFCRTCNQRLDFVDTRQKKKMPVEHTSFTGNGRPLPFGTYINAEGDVLKHTEIPDGMVVWRIHFQDCEKSGKREVIEEAYKQEFIDAFTRIDSMMPYVDRPATRTWGRHEAYGHIVMLAGMLTEQIAGERKDEARNTLADIAAAVVHYLTTGDKYTTTDLIPPTFPEVVGWIREEAVSAIIKHGDAPWTEHEMLGILLEEIEEAFDNIKANGPAQALRTELLQVAAVCVRHLTRPMEED